MIEITTTGVLFQNPLPATQALQAQFPGLCKLSDQELICVYKRGPAPQAIETDYALTRSTDGGHTWHDEGVIWDRAQDDRPYSYGYGYPFRLENGEILLAGYRWDRSDSDDDLNIYNPATLGAVPCDALVFRSGDNGRTWRAPSVVAPPNEVAMVNVSGRIVALPGGRLMLPLESWKAWDDPGPIKQRSLVAFSDDGGETWGDYVIAAMDVNHRILHWNGMFSRLDNGRLLAMYWGKDTQTEQDITIPATSSENDGRTWSPVYDTGISGQMGCTIGVGGGRVLAIYNRRDAQTPGVWAAISEDGGRTWPSIGHVALWDARGRDLLGDAAGSNRSRSIYDEGTMAFGKPDAIYLDDNRYLAAFWCTSNFVMNLRYAHLAIH